MQSRTSPSRFAIFRAIASVMLVALLVRAAVPTGWMVARADSGAGIKIELCSGRVVTLDPASRKVTGLHGDAQPDHPAGDVPVGDHGDPSQMAPCPFAVAAIMAQADARFVFVAPAMPRDNDRMLPQPRAPPELRTISAPLPARGPPLFS